MPEGAPVTPLVSTPVSTPIDRPPSTTPAPIPAVPITAQWIVSEHVGNATRWLLVAGLVPRGTEADPAADTDYMVIRTVDEAFARKSGLPVRTLTIPRFYVLPEAFTVTMHVETDPRDARVYEMLANGALIPHGRGPIDLTFTGTVSDLRVSLAGATWLIQDIPAGGTTIGLWAATDSMASAAGPTPISVPLLTAADLVTLRAGSHALSKRYALAVHTPLDPKEQAVILRVVVEGVH